MCLVNIDLARKTAFHLDRFKTNIVQYPVFSNSKISEQFRFTYFLRESIKRKIKTPFEFGKDFFIEVLIIKTMY